MKALALLLGLVLCLSINAREGYTPIAPEDISNLEDVMTIGTKASLTLALEEGKINPAVFHIDKLLSLAKQDRDDATSYEVIVQVSDKYNPSVTGVVEYIIEQSAETNEYVLKAHFVTFNNRNKDSDF